MAPVIYFGELPLIFLAPHGPISELAGSGLDDWPAPIPHSSPRSRGFPWRRRHTNLRAPWLSFSAEKGWKFETRKTPRIFGQYDTMTLWALSNLSHFWGHNWVIQKRSRISSRSQVAWIVIEGNDICQIQRHIPGLMPVMASSEKTSDGSWWIWRKNGTQNPIRPTYSNHCKSSLQLHLPFPSLSSMVNWGKVLRSSVHRAHVPELEQSGTWTVNHEMIVNFWWELLTGMNLIQ